MGNNMFRRLPVEQATGQLYGGRHRLRVAYRTRDLIVLGLGVMIGSGIFKIAGVQAATAAGPAVIVSFVIAGVVCLLAALFYAELASIVPVAGSAYSYSYVAFGELWAWVVGWALILEMLLAASVVARAWSVFAAQALSDFAVPVPSWLAGLVGQPKGFDLFALGILLLLVAVLATGSRLGLRTLWFMVLAKVVVIGLVIGVGLTFFDPGNLSPFVPEARPAADGSGQTVLDAVLGAATGSTPQVFGIWGVLAAAPAIAFAYIGFDLIATAAEETRDAPRSIPRGIIVSLVTTVVLYIGVAVTMVGMVSYARLDPSGPVLTTAFDAAGAGVMGKVIDVGAVLGLTTVILVVLIALTRVVFSMSRDGLLPRGLAETRRYGVPFRAAWVSGGAAIVMSQTLDVLTLEQMVVIGTLFAFLFVPAGVLALRRDRPDLHRPFRVPLAPLTAALAIGAVGWLMLNLKVQTWAYFLVWMALGVLVYLVYGRRKSQLRRLLAEEPPGPPRRRPGAGGAGPGGLPPGVVPYPADRLPSGQHPAGVHPRGGPQDTATRPAAPYSAPPPPDPYLSQPYSPRTPGTGPQQQPPANPYAPGASPHQTGGNPPPEPGGGRGRHRRDDEPQPPYLDEHDPW
ncbi:amino acid permease [Actinomadura sp. NPDC047616]|uniref:APC family permease n=1 Tax=Actinomadura sp. NPDC047616 TaxID=3155914 RepID=UPI0033C59EA8